jgi:hypothetical protein
MNHKEKILQAISDAAQRNSVKPKDITRNYQNSKDKYKREFANVCRFHAELNEAGYLYGPVFQAEIFNIDSNVILQRITKHYERSNYRSRHHH